MATTSLWRVKSHIGSVIRYAENEKKTVDRKKPDDKGESFAPDSEESLLQVLDYASRDSATKEQRYVTPLNCSLKHAAEDMQAIKRAFGKEDGTIAYHGFQSFKQGEVTPEIAHEIGVKLADELWGDQYQVVVATHLDKESHIHNHFVINTVSFIDGKKYCRTNADYQAMRQASDRLCREYGLSVVTRPQGKGKTYAEWKAEQDRTPTYRELIRKDIDAAIRESRTDIDFFNRLRERGYEFKFYRQDYETLERPSLRPKGATRFFRFDRLGKGYDIEEIIDRVFEPDWSETIPADRQRSYEARVNAGLPKEYYSLGGFTKVLYLFLYLIGLIRDYPEVHPVMSKEYRQDVLKEKKYFEQYCLLVDHDIHDANDLMNFISERKDYLGKLMKVRTGIHALLSDPELPPNRRGDLREKLHGTREEISRVRKQVRTAEDFRQRVTEIQKKVIDLAGPDALEGQKKVDLRPDQPKADQTTNKPKSSPEWAR
ncbi:MAG: relaxase/mobilization nuclease domain-containing protein [Lachnospiraceae bacterium]|nr:relaxase/mobilization nuclease domain-containing protein [Lachnospiraceae bacterium]